MVALHEDLFTFISLLFIKETVSSVTYERRQCPQ